jgi:sugar phosphate permease
MILQHHSWRSVFVAAGVVSVLLALLTLAFVRNRPEDAGFPSLRAMQGQAEHAPRARHWLPELARVLGNRDAWPGFWVNFGVTGTLFAFAGLWGIPLLQDVHGLTRTQAALYTTASLAGFALGCLVMGWVSDRLGRRRPVVIGAAAVSCLAWAALAGLPWGPGAGGLALYSLLGLAAGGFVVTYAAAKEVVAPAVAGMAIALVNTGLFLGAALMQPAFGWVLDLGWDGTLVAGVRRYALGDYRNALWLCCAGTVVALVAALRLRETRCRNVAD